MNHPELQSPFSWMSERGQSYALGVLALLLVGLSIALAMIDRALVTDTAPHGIISYEFAGTAAWADLILRSWSPVARESAMLSLGLDYLYLVVYPAFISLACARIAARLRGKSSAAAWLGVRLSWVILAAGVLDAVENYALIRLLSAGPSDLWAAAAWWCAAPKLTLIGLGLAFALSGYIASRFIGSSDAGGAAAGTIAT